MSKNEIGGFNDMESISQHSVKCLKISLITIMDT